MLVKLGLHPAGARHMHSLQMNALGIEYRLYEKKMTVTF